MTGAGVCAVLESILAKPARRVVGLSSGTSMDGMDAVLARVEGAGARTSVGILAFETVPYPAPLRARLARAAGSAGVPTREVCRLNVEVGDLAARAAEAVAARAGVTLEDVDLVGSHGQTLCHLPEEIPPSSLQVGESAVIAERTGVTTVSNFRARDLAAGGQGAPLVPYVDWILLGSREETRVALNLGGIANLTVLPRAAGLESVRAFDVGPGNMVIDGVAEARTGGRVRCDRGGRGAAAGRAAPEILEMCLRHPYFRQSPPKSTGRETFGESFVDALLSEAERADLSDEDLLATVTELTARTVAEAILACGSSDPPVDRVIASGGGVHNRTLMGRLAALVAPIPVDAVDAFGVPSDAKEAVAFAVLANETIHGIPANVPGATGARGAVILGQITPGRRP